MNIGICGYGLVGSAVGIGLADIGHTIYAYDTKFNDKCIPDEYITDAESKKDVWPLHTDDFMDLLKCDVVFICVPTPANKDGSCDTSIVESCVMNLWGNNYKGIIAIKSTVTPGTTQRLIDLYKTHKICFVPEFLRERFAIQDFLEEQDLCVVGTDSDEVFNIVKECHGPLPKQIIKIKPTEAELVKYFNNIFNATLITLANSFYELCRIMKVDYSRIKQALVQRNHINDIYLDCNEWLRGFGGQCLPKDAKAIMKLCDDLKLHSIHFFANILQQNEKFLPTVFNGMRQQ